MIILCACKKKNLEDTRLESQGSESQTVRINEMKHQQSCVSYTLSNYKIMERRIDFKNDRTDRELQKKMQ
jgi:hypothetical protein